MSDIPKLSDKAIAGGLTCPRCGKPTLIRIPFGIHDDRVVDKKIRVFFIITLAFHLQYSLGLQVDYCPACGFNDKKVLSAFFSLDKLDK